MPERPVWYSTNSVIVYHLFDNCRSLQNVDDKYLAEKVISLDRDGHARHDATIRLCGHCYNRLWRRKLKNKLRLIRKFLRQ